jgi:hypothetical protein
MRRVMVILAAALSNWALVPAAVRANGPITLESAQVVQVMQSKTIAEANKFLTDHFSVTPEAFLRWSGATRIPDALGDCWRLADGVMVIGCIESRPGVYEISCWGVRK